MKEIAVSNNGHLVELNKEEYDTIMMLARIKDGYKREYTDFRFVNDTEVDLTNTLKTIYSFVELKYSVKEMQSLLNKFEIVLEGKE